jgi:hypothetical protein
MEVDFNCTNKLYGVWMLDNARHHALMPDEIFSEKKRIADNSSLAKTLFYNLVCQSQQPAGLSLVDADNCYDRIAHAIALLVCQLFGVPQESIGSMLCMIQERFFFSAPHTETQRLQWACAWKSRCKDSSKGMVPLLQDGWW